MLKATMLNELHLKLEHFWMLKIGLNCVTEVTCVTNAIINYDLDITDILVVSPQIHYMEVFDVMNPPFNEEIWPVPSDFIKSRFHCSRKPNYWVFCYPAIIFDLGLSFSISHTIFLLLIVIHPHFLV